MEHYSAIKRSQALICPTTWINTENIIPSERRLTQKENTLYESMIMKCTAQVIL
jgi:hypothetical protein